MAGFHPAGHERVNVFPAGGTRYFKHFFEEDEVFDELRPFYNHYAYRFEVPEDEFEALRTTLTEFGYALVEVDAVEEFVVVKRKYTDHPRILFAGSVLRRSVPDHHCFVMKDRDAVKRAVAAGAVRLTDADLDFELD